MLARAGRAPDDAPRIVVRLERLAAGWSRQAADADRRLRDVAIKAHALDGALDALPQNPGVRIKVGSASMAGGSFAGRSRRYRLSLNTRGAGAIS